LRFFPIAEHQWSRSPSCVILVEIRRKYP